MLHRSRRRVLFPAVAADGRILFSREAEPVPEAPEVLNLDLVQLDPESGEVTEVFASPWRDLWPAPHPAGREVAFFSRAATGGESDDLFAYDLETGVLRRLTVDPGNDFVPAWSPDGHRIAYAANGEGAPSIYLMNADGSGVERLTGLDTRESHPAWSPDSRRLYFTTREPGEAGEIVWLEVGE